MKIKCQNVGKYCVSVWFDTYLSMGNIVLVISIYNHFDIYVYQRSCIKNIKWAKQSMIRKNFNQKLRNFWNDISQEKISEWPITM